MKFTVLFFLIISPGLAHAGVEFTNEPQVADFIAGMVSKHGFTEDELSKHFENAQFIERSIQLMDRPAESLDWTTYMGRVITRARLKAGVSYFRRHKKELLQAQKTYKVPAYIIAGVIGLETNFGQIQMRFRAFDTLATLAFFYPRRAQFFKNELTELLLTAREGNTDPFSYMSSYAGAVGIPQFMPSNIKKFAVDGNNDKTINIVTNHTDAIFSVANYLSKHGWKSGAPVAWKVRVKGSGYTKLITNSPCSTQKTSVMAMKKAGIIFDNKVDSKLMGSIIAVDEPKGKVGYYAVFGNFCAIYRYNPSLRYALAVRNIGKYIIDQEAAALRKATKTPAKK